MTRSLQSKAILVALMLAMGALVACGNGGGSAGDNVNPSPPPATPNPAPTPSPSVSVLAGSLKSAGGQDGVGEEAGFNTPEGVAFDSAGNIYVTDKGNHTIRRLAPDGAVTTIAGAPGQAGSMDGTGAQARFSSPRGIAADASGNLYVADTGNHTVRRITPGGVVSTFVGATGQSGTTDGAANVARFSSPTEVAIGPDGALYVAGDYAVRKVRPDGFVSTFVGVAGQHSPEFIPGLERRFAPITGVAVDASGHVYVTEAAGGGDGAPWGRLHRFNAVGQSVGFGTTTAALFAPFASGVAVDPAGNVYVASSGSAHGFATTFSYAVYRVTSQGQLTLVAGSDWQAAIPAPSGQAPVRFPLAVAIGSLGRVVFSDADNHAIRQIDSQTNSLATLAGGAGAGKLDGSGAQARFFGLGRLAVTADDSLLVAESRNASVRKVNQLGAVSTLKLQPEDGPSFESRSLMDVAQGPQGALYLLKGGGVWGCAAAGLCTRLQTNRFVSGIFSDAPSGNLYLAGEGQVSVIGANGVERVLATGLDFGFDLDIVVTSGKIFIADSRAHVIRVIGASGELLQTIGAFGVEGYADGNSQQARFSFPTHLALDATGNLYVADKNHTIRKVTPAGAVTTVAGVAGQSGVKPGLALAPLGPISGLAWLAGALYASVDNVLVKINPVN